VRVLYVTNAFPFPLTSGYLRHYHLLRHLAARHDVHLLSLAGADHRPEHRAEIERFGVTCEVFARGPKRVQRATKLVPGLALGGLRALREAARCHIDTGDVDVTVFSGKQTAAVLGALRGRPVLADVCDATSSRLAGEAKARRGLDRARLGVEWASVRVVEARLRRQADHALFASERDRELLGWPVERCTVVPNGVDGDRFRRTVPDLGRDTVVFTGKLDYPPNEDAAIRLAEDVLPRLRARVPSVELLLVGLRPTPRLVAAAARTGAVVTGEVPDVRPYLERASVFAAPLRFGAGIQNKVLEALAMDVPVVCSSLAAAGLRIDGAAPPLEVADDVDELVAALARRVELAADEPAAGSGGSSFVARHFSWERSAAAVDEQLARLVGRTERAVVHGSPPRSGAVGGGFGAP
jgi:glycosyltransferase involved in cell wall biosynthesis